MNSRLVNLITAVIGIALMATFVVGLSNSISTGFAGFEGGLPFMVIVGFVLLLVLYDFWDQCLRRKR